jgi:hypothetical protein
LRKIHAPMAAAAEGLLQACLQGQLAEALQALRELPDDPHVKCTAANAVGPGGWTPLLAAARLGGAQLIEALVGVELRMIGSSCPTKMQLCCMAGHQSPATFDVMCSSRPEQTRSPAAQGAATLPCTVSRD